MRRKSHTMEVNGKTLELFCSDNPPQTPLEHQVRGVVFSGSKMILQGFPYSNEQIITEKSTEEEISFLYKNNDWTITEAIEGTLIRIFYFNDKWIITTHRKLDAFKSKWGSEKSFGDIFKEAVMIKTQDSQINDDVDVNTLCQKLGLNKHRQYTFLITATDKTRFVCPSTPIPIVYLYAITEKINNKTTIINENDSEMKKWNDWKQESLHLKAPEAIQFVQNLSFPFKCQGLLFFNSKTFESYKLVNKTYQEYFDVRGNIPSVPFAYLHILGNKNKIQMFKQMISEKDIETIEKYEKTIQELIVELHNLYLKRYVEKDTEMKTDKSKHKFLLGLHEWFKNQREKCVSTGAIPKIRVTQNVVSKILLESDPPVINRLIKEKINPSSPTSLSPPSSNNNSPVRSPIRMSNQNVTG